MTELVRDAAGTRLPGFAVVLRGYDRQEVDAVVEELEARLVAERRRAQEAELMASDLQRQLDLTETAPPPSFEHLGAEAARVLEQAGNAAKLLLEEARTRGEDIVKEAEARALAQAEHIQRRATELEASAQQTLAEAVAERDRILAEAGERAEHLRGSAEEEARTTVDDARETAARLHQQATAERQAVETETEHLRGTCDGLLAQLRKMHVELGGLLAGDAPREEVAAVAAVAAD